MKHKFLWPTLLGVSASIAFAQSPGTVERPAFDPAKSPVKVVYAPGHRSQPMNDPLPFTAVHGVVGMSVPAESMVVSIATIGDDGKLQFQCVQAAEAAKRVKVAKPLPPRSRKESANEK